MPTTSSPSARRPSLFAFVTLAALALSAVEAGHAQRAAGNLNEAVKLSVRISVTDQDGGGPVPGAEVTIRRQGTDPAGAMLRNRKARTDAKGEVSMDEVDFRLGGAPHRVLVNAKDFRNLELELPDIVLREAAHINGQLTLALSLASQSVRPESPGGDSLPPQEAESMRNLLYRPRAWLSAAAVLTMLFIVAFVTWRVWLRSPFSHRAKAAPASVDLKTLDMRLSLISQQVRKLATKEDVQTLAKSLTSVTEIVKESGRAAPARATTATLPVEGRVVRSLPFEERARSSYLKLTNREQPEIKPLYADADTKSTPLWKMADSTVYLRQKGHRQAAFVLFTEDDRWGWVFPNPLVFSGNELKEVFPGLTEAEFESARDKVRPVAVSRVGDARWKVES